MYASNKIEIESTLHEKKHFIANSPKAMEVESNTRRFFSTPYETKNLSLDDSRPSSPSLQYQEAPSNNATNALVSTQTPSYTLLPDYLTNHPKLRPYQIPTSKKTEAQTRTSPDILSESISSLYSSIINIFEYISNYLKTPNNQGVGKNKIPNPDSNPPQILKSLECVSNLFCCFPNNSQRKP